jgi:hypothetical protein
MLKLQQLQILALSITILLLLVDPTHENEKMQILDDEARNCSPEGCITDSDSAGARTGSSS